MADVIDRLTERVLLDIAKQRLDALVARRRVVEGRLNPLIAQEASRRQAIDAAQQKLESGIEQLQQDRALLDQLLEQIEEARALMVELGNSEDPDAAGAAAEARVVLANLEREYDAACAEKERLRVYLVRLDGQIKQARAQLAHLNSQIDSVQAELAQLDASIEQATQVVAQLSRT